MGTPQKQNRRRLHDPAWPRVELGGRRYVILPETAYQRLVRDARRDEPRDWLTPEGPSPFAENDVALGARLAERRQEAGLTQSGLARAAGIRPETLNRIERGRTSPDFATIRRLVVAMNGAGCGRVNPTPPPRATRRSRRRLS
jgi:DNA-binding XRE family transcriptional regulator